MAHWKAAGFTSVTPYLAVRDAVAAVQFYERAFGAELTMKLTMADGKYAHAEIRIGDAHLMLSEENPAWGNRSPQSLGGSPVFFMIYVPDVDATYKRAIDAGCTPVRPVQGPVLRRSQRHRQRSLRLPVDAVDPPGRRERGRRPAAHGTHVRRRAVNACNTRFLNLQLYIADGSANGITLNALGNPTNTPSTSKLYSTMLIAAPEVLQIGTEGGFLNKPTRVPTNLPFNPVTMTGSLIVAPAERPDIIIDFAAMAGKDIILYNDAPAPFPMVDPRADYFPGWNIKANPTNATTAPGYGPNSRVLMRFRVANTASSADAPLGIFDTTLMPGIDAPLVPTAATPVRQVTLNEGFDAYGRLIQMLGTTVPLASPSAGFGRGYIDPATEVVPRGTTEVWEVFNTTADVHPMHWHLINMQVINRQPFQARSLGSTKGGVNYTGPAVAAPASENGYKETVPMYPGTVTRFVAKIDLPATPFAVPVSPRTGGHEYVWHCHILEHEEHDMMRPLIVT